MKGLLHLSISAQFSPGISASLSTECETPPGPVYCCRPSEHQLKSLFMLFIWSSHTLMCCAGKSHHLCSPYTWIPSSAVLKDCQTNRSYQAVCFQARCCPLVETYQTDAEVQHLDDVLLFWMFGLNATCPVTLESSLSLLPWANEVCWCVGGPIAKWKVCVTFYWPI